MSPFALAFGDEPCIIDAPRCAGRQSNQHRTADVDRRARVVQDLEQVEHRQVVVLEFDDDARLGTDLDHAGTRRRFRRRVRFGLFLRRPRRRCRRSARRERRPWPGPETPATSASRHRRSSWPAPAVPAASPSNCARPCSSVLPLRDSLPTLSVTACPAMLLPIRSRTTRTVTVRSGNSGAGSGVPAIARGIGHVDLRARCARQK